MKKALFIGINEYAELDALSGCENDAAKWQKHYLDTPMGGLISRLEHLHTVVQPPSTKISLNMKFRIFFWRV